jgi:diamine N-acetyltransferase
MKYELRNIESIDHEWLIELHNDPEVLYNLTNPQPITLESHMKWWKSIECSNTQKRFIFTINDQPIGLSKIIDIDYNNNNCMLGADIHKDFRGMGYAKILWGCMLEYCFESLKLHRVGLTTAVYNIRAQHIYKKLGFKEEGRLIGHLYRDNNYFDQILMYMLYDDWKYSNK